MIFHFKARLKYNIKWKSIKQIAYLSTAYIYFFFLL